MYVSEHGLRCHAERGDVVPESLSLLQNVHIWQAMYGQLSIIVRKDAPIYIRTGLYFSLNISYKERTIIPIYPYCTTDSV